MGTDVIDIPKPDVIDPYGRRGVADPLVHSPATSDAGFLGQISGNPFFTAVSGDETPQLCRQKLIQSLGHRSCWLRCCPRGCPKRRSSWRDSAPKTIAG